MRRLDRNVIAVLSLLPLAMLATIAAGAPPETMDATPKAKSPLTGLVQMGDIRFHREDGGLAHPELGALLRFPGIFGGTVINITWEQLEPKRGTLETKEIDQLLNDIRAYNQANPQHPLGARLRVWPGTNAPLWAKNLDGPPVKVLHLNMPITVGRFWAPAYRKAWRDLQTRLAARYDREPLIREVCNTSGSSMTDESMLLPGDSESVKNLLAAGFTDRQYQECLLQSPEDYAGWVSTRVECVCNPYRTIDSGKPRADKEFTIKVMRHWRQQLGSRCVLSSHSLNKPLNQAVDRAGIFDEMRRLGPPLAFQTHSPHGLDWEGALRLGRDLGAGSIELWSGTQSGGFETKTLQLLRQWANLFE